MGSTRWIAAWGIGMLMALAGPMAGPVLAQAVTTPPPRSPERQAILEALRQPIERELGAPVAFRVTMLRVSGDWALMTGVPQRPGGRAIDYSKTRFAEDQREGAFDDNVQALLRRRDGQWRVVTYVLGATDVSWAAWPAEYPAAPGALFPKIQ